MLYAVLHAIETASGPVLLSDLSRELAIEPAILRDMLAFWQRKGRLSVEGNLSTGSCSAGSSHGTHCGASCSGTESCVFTIRIPTSSVITPTQVDP